MIESTVISSCWFFVWEDGESVFVRVNQDIKKWKLIIDAVFISKSEYGIVLVGQL